MRLSKRGHPSHVTGALLIVILGNACLSAGCHRDVVRVIFLRKLKIVSNETDADQGQLAVVNHIGPNDPNSKNRQPPKSIRGFVQPYSSIRELPASAKEPFQEVKPMRVLNPKNHPRPKPHDSVRYNHNPTESSAGNDVLKIRRPNLYQPHDSDVVTDLPRRAFDAPLFIPPIIGRSYKVTASAVTVNTPRLVFVKPPVLSKKETNSLQVMPLVPHDNTTKKPLVGRMLFLPIRPNLRGFEANLPPPADPHLRPQPAIKLLKEVKEASHRQQQQQPPQQQQPFTVFRQIPPRFKKKNKKEKKMKEIRITTKTFLAMQIGRGQPERKKETVSEEEGGASGKAARKREHHLREGKNTIGTPPLNPQPVPEGDDLRPKPKTGPPVVFNNAVTKPRPMILPTRLRRKNSGRPRKMTMPALISAIIPSAQRSTSSQGATQTKPSSSLSSAKASKGGGGPLALTQKHVKLAEKGQSTPGVKNVTPRSEKSASKNASTLQELKDNTKGQHSQIANVFPAGGKSSEVLMSSVVIYFSGKTKSIVTTKTVKAAHTNFSHFSSSSKLASSKITTLKNKVSSAGSSRLTGKTTGAIALSSKRAGKRSTSTKIQNSSFSTPKSREGLSKSSVNSVVSSVVQSKEQNSSPTVKSVASSTKVSSKGTSRLSRVPNSTTDPSPKLALTARSSIS